MRPLEDVRIVSLEQYGAGPFGSLHLADLGAEVIKVEDPSAGGDIGRSIPPYAHDGDSLFFETFNRNKRSVSIDMSTPGGREVFHDLVAESDVVYSNLRGDVPAKLGLLYDDLKHLNPRIVCVSLTGFGMTGPRAGQPGFDIVMQALAGWMDLTGEPAGPPTRSGLSLVDYCGGFVAGLSTLAGLHAARRDGIGGDADVSLYDTAISMLTYPAVWQMNAGFTPVRMPKSAHPSVIPFQAFETADGWMVAGGSKEKYWRQLVHVLDRPELSDDPRFDSFAVRHENRETLLPILEAAFRERTTGEWLALLEPAGVPCGAVNDVEGALADPQTQARDLVVETEHERFGTLKNLASPVRFGSGSADYRRAPRRNEDADHVLDDVLGYDAERRAQLASGGAFGEAEAQAEPVGARSEPH